MNMLLDSKIEQLKQLLKEKNQCLVDKAKLLDELRKRDEQIHGLEVRLFDQEEKFLSHNEELGGAEGRGNDESTLVIDLVE